MLHVDWCVFRKGSGRKPKSVEERSKNQTTGRSRTQPSHNLRTSSGGSNVNHNRVANILPATASASTTRDDVYAQTYENTTFNTVPERCPLVACIPTPPPWVCPPLPLPLISKELYGVSPSTSWSANGNLEIQSVHEVDNPDVGFVEQIPASSSPANAAQQLLADYTSTDLTINPPLSSFNLEGLYPQSETTRWNVSGYTNDVNGSSGLFNESNSGMPNYSPALSHSSYSPYMWPSSPMTLSSPSQESPASSFSSLESPVASAPLTLQTPKPRRRPRRCAVCITYGEDLNALACPGRGDRNRCPLSRKYDSNLTPYGDIAENPYLQPGQTPVLHHEDLNIYAKYINVSNVDISPPFTISTIENTPRRPRHCKICTTTGRAGTTCPGRGNRTLCPDFVQ